MTRVLEIKKVFSIFVFQTILYIIHSFQHSCEKVCAYAVQREIESDELEWNISS